MEACEKGVTLEEIGLMVEGEILRKATLPLRVWELLTAHLEDCQVCKQRVKALRVCCERRKDVCQRTAWIVGAMGTAELALLVSLLPGKTASNLLHLLGDSRHERQDMR